MGGGASTPRTQGLTVIGTKVRRMREPILGEVGLFYVSTAIGKPDPLVIAALLKYQSVKTLLGTDTAVDVICRDYLGEWYTLQTEAGLRLVENFAHQVDIPDKPSIAAIQRATDVLDIVYHLQGKYITYLHKCLYCPRLDGHCRLPRYIETIDPTSRNKAETYKDRRIIPLVKVGFGTLGFGISDDETCQLHYGLFEKDITVKEPIFDRVDTPNRAYVADPWTAAVQGSDMPYQWHPPRDVGDLVYIPLFVTWGESGHQISMYYQSASNRRPIPVVWVFEPGGSTAMWAMIKGHVKLAINTFLYKYNGSSAIRFTEIDHGPRGQSGQLGQLGGVTFRQELKGPVDVYVSQPPFMQHSDTTKESKSKCLWACLRHFTWVATGVYDIIERQERGFLLYQEMLMALCAQVVPIDTKTDSQWIEAVTSKYRDWSRSIPTPMLPAAGAGAAPTAACEPLKKFI